MKNSNYKDDIWTKITTLVGERIDLIPLDLQLADELAQNTISKNNWHCVHWGIKTKNDVSENISKLIESNQNQICLPFMFKDKISNQVVGCSRFMTISRENKRLEIGGTWIGEKWQNTHVNTEAKYLMLKYAFEELGCYRVEFKVDALNFKSQKAVTRIGAKYEGELRNYIIQSGERKKDYKMYSIIDSEWPNVKTLLSWYMERY